jgi:hypothetical protein
MIPYYAGGGPFAKRDAEQQLRAGTYIFRMGRAVTLRGTVLSPDGAPIPKASILVGKWRETHNRETQSGADGAFEAKGCQPGRTLVTAEAEGFSATTVQMELSSSSEPLRLTVQPGKVLRLRVVSQAGQPVAHADVWLDTLNALEPGAVRPEANFEKETDAEGGLVWSNAPGAEMEFTIVAGGYMRMDHFKVRPDAQEHIVTLSPGLVVSGTVRDAATGELIPRFRIITGWPQTNPVKNASNPTILIPSVQGSWPTLERYWVNYTGGKFRHVLEEPALYGPSNPGYMLKFDAEGYAALVSRVIAPDEGVVQMDVALRRFYAP